MWKFEQVFSDDGSELSTAGLSTALGQTLNGVYDGRFMWVTSANGIGIYEFWGASSDDEPTVDEVDDLLWARYTELGPKRKLKLITFITVGAQVKRSTRYLSLSKAPSWVGGAGSTVVGDTTITFTQSREDLLVATEVSTNALGTLSPYWIVLIGDKICVSNGASFNKVFVFSTVTQQLESVLTLGNEPNGSTTTANSNLLGQNNRIWCVNSLYDDFTPQRLISKDITSLVETSTSINVRPSSTRTWLANGFNDFVYITNYNGVSVSRYNETTGVLGARIRTSALPHHIFSTQDRRIFVGSGDNLLTSVDWDDDGVHYDNNSESVASSLVRDPIDAGKMWITRSGGNQLVRLTLLDGDFMEVGAEVKDWVVNSSGITAPTQVLSVPSQVFTTALGASRSTRPYIFVLSGTSVYLIAADNLLKRDFDSAINGQGAIVGGTLQYFGEQG